MRFVFKRKRERELYYHETGAEKYPPAVVAAFFRVMSLIDAALNENEFRAFRSRKFKKLKGDREGKRSLRLNDQYRLIVTIEQDNQGKYVFIHGIEKHR